MMRKNSLLGFILVALLVHQSGNAKQIIGIRPTNSFSYHPGQPARQIIGARQVGFFANFFAVLNTIAWCEKEKVMPVVYWDKRFPYWQTNGYNNAMNGWEYYFEPVSGGRYQKGDTMHCRYLAPDGSGMKYCSSECIDLLVYKHSANALIKKYIKIKKVIQNKIDAFAERHFQNKKIVGIHLRGTDKKQEVTPVDPQKILSTANSYHAEAYFVATDEQKFLELAKKQLNAPVIHYDADRSTTGKPLHLAGGNAKRGEDVLVEVILLSKCSRLIHTCSNVSCAVLFFNPSLEHILLSAPKGFALR